MTLCLSVTSSLYLLQCLQWTGTRIVVTPGITCEALVVMHLRSQLDRVGQ